MEESKNLFNLIKAHKYNQFRDKVNELGDEVDLNIRDTSNNYLINYAIIFNDINTVKFLLEKNSSIDVIDSDGKSILYIPLKFGYRDIFKLLIKYSQKQIGVPITDIKDDNGNIPLNYAIKFKDEEGVDKLLEISPQSVNEKNKSGFTPLHIAVYSKNIVICKKILEVDGLNINSQFNTGETALHIACNFELIDITKLLVKYGIDINIQDTDNEFTALNYCINLNNIKLVKFLIDSGVDVNIQDFYGNTVLHHSIIEDSIESFDTIMQKSNINVNIYNAEGKLPMHYVFEGSNPNIYSLVNILLKPTNINIQDNKGFSVLHYLIKSELWKYHKDVLQNKKLDVFIQNQKFIRPIDLVEKTDLNEFIELVVNSYLNMLRNSAITWKNQWENECKEEKDDDKCKKKIKNKLMKIYQKKIVEGCDTRSYPVKKNSVCIDIKEGEPVEFCTFLGNTLDILIALINILQIHRAKICSILTTDFVENKNLCRYYKTLGITTSNKCEFMNFEIIWVYKKLYMNKNFTKNFTKCLQKDTRRFIVVPLGIELREGSHANYLIYDRKRNEIERFEPHGSHSPYKFNYDPDLLDKTLEKRFNDIDESIVYVPPKQFLPKIGFQIFDSYENSCRKHGDPGGFCGLWAVWYVDLRIKYPDIDRKKLIKKIIKDMKKKHISFKNTIRNYSKQITDIRDKVLSKANLTFNDWYNGQFTDEQMLTVVEGLTEIIDKLSS